MMIWLPTTDELEHAPEFAALAPLDHALHVAMLALRVVDRHDYYRPDRPDGRSPHAGHMAQSIAVLADTLRHCLSEYRVARRAPLIPYDVDLGSGDAGPDTGAQPHA
jgi:hypothetical protein